MGMSPGSEPPLLGSDLDDPYPLLAAARRRGARVVTGEDMFRPQADILADYLVLSGASPKG